MRGRRKGDRIVKAQGLLQLPAMTHRTGQQETGLHRSCAAARTAHAKGDRTPRFTGERFAGRFLCGLLGGRLRLHRRDANMTHQIRIDELRGRRAERKNITFGRAMQAASGALFSDALNTMVGRGGARCSQFTV